MQPTNQTDAAIVASLQALSRHLGDLMEQVDALRSAVEHREHSAILDQTALDLRTLCTHPEFTLLPAFALYVEGQDHA